jgi:hypothetical protein
MDLLQIHQGHTILDLMKVIILQQIYFNLSPTYPLKLRLQQRNAYMLIVNYESMCYSF